MIILFFLILAHCMQSESPIFGPIRHHSVTFKLLSRHTRTFLLGQKETIFSKKTTIRKYQKIDNEE